MAHRPMNPRSQKEENRRFSAHYKKRPSTVNSSLSPRSHRSSYSPRSPPDHRTRAFQDTHLAPNIHKPPPLTMPIIMSAALRRWLLEKGFEGYIRVAESLPHPGALDIANKLNVDTITNATLRKKLGLSAIGEKHFDVARKILQWVFNDDKGV